MIDTKLLRQADDDDDDDDDDADDAGEPSPAILA